MPPKRAQASNPQPAPLDQQHSVPAVELNEWGYLSPQEAKIDKAAQNILETIGLSRDELENFDDRTFAVLLAMVRQFVQRIVSPEKRPDSVLIETFSKQDVTELVKVFSRDYPDVHFAIADPDSAKPKVHLLPRSTRRQQRALKEARNLTPEESRSLPDAAERILRGWYTWATTARAIHELAVSERSSVPADDRAIEVPQPKTAPPTHGRPMPEDKYADQLNHYASQLGRRLLEKSFSASGVRYIPLSLAAPLAQAPETTIRDWIKNKKLFGGRKIKTHTSPTGGLSISEQSVESMSRRFIQWPSGEPAGPVTIGRTDNGSGYIALTEAARSLGMDRHTLWRWTTKGTAPTDQQAFDVIKCPASNQFYISEKDVAALRKHIPGAGLHAGRRAQPS